MEPARRFLIVIGALALGLLAFSLRFSAPEFRPWELLREKDRLFFEPGRRVEMEEIGDLGYKSWVRALQHPRHVVFTTDRWGFRNPRDLEAPPVVVVGDSYVAGAGVSDEQTLTARLTARLGVPVYNYALQLGGTPQLFFADERWKAAPPKLVIYAPGQRLLYPRPLLLPGNRWPEPRRPSGPFEHAAAVEKGVQDFVAALNRDNGLAVAARYAWHEGCDRLFGAPGTAIVDGRRILVPSIEAQFLHVPPRDRGYDRVVEMLKGFQELLAERRIKFLFCPIPEVGTLYPDLYPPEDRARIQRPSTLDLVIAGARDAGVQTLDLRAAFEPQRTPYLFQPDDSHWNPRAIDLTAEAITRKILEDAPR